MKKIEKEFLKSLLSTKKWDDYLKKLANFKKEKIYGNEFFVRGLIEFTNFCKNNCFYCNLRKDNFKLNRYRLSEKEILKCCEKGYEFGLKSFVLQGGEDCFFDDSKICSIVSKIRRKFPNCSIALSIGERSELSYEKFFKAGANRFLLRHEAANNEYYKTLHPKEMSLKNRKNCLFNLKKIGYQVGSGFIVGLPNQTMQNLIEDIAFLSHLKPAMIGIGPFIKSNNTPFRNFEDGDFNLTLRLISILRIIFPSALIPATTALCLKDRDGLKEGLKAGANVVMVNISPNKAKELYCLYPEKIKNREHNNHLEEKLNHIKNVAKSLNLKISSSV